MSSDVHVESDNIKVLFRLSNRQVPTRCLTASYVAFDAFLPDADALHDLHVFERCVSHRDFERIIFAINSLLPPFRSRSLQVSLLAILLSFGAVAVIVLASVPGGVTMQVLTFLVHTIVQAWMRTALVEKANKLLEETVNEPLVAARGVFVVVDAHHEGCCNFLDVDFCVKQRVVVAGGSGGGSPRRRRSGAGWDEPNRNNPLESTVLESATSGSFS